MNYTKIISPPKAGRTWLRVLYGKVLCNHLDLADDQILKIDRLVTKANVDICAVKGFIGSYWTHDDSEYHRYRYSYSRLEIDKTKYRKFKIVFLRRNLKDLLVSNYFHSSKRLKSYSEPIQKYIRDESMGIKRYIRFYEIWYEQQKVAKDFLCLSYELLQKNAFEEMGKFLKFNNCIISDEHLKDAITFASFDSMKEMEKNNSFKTSILQPVDRNDDESYKVRKGKVGGYVDYLTTEDIEFLNNEIDKSTCPWCKDQ